LKAYHNGIYRFALVVVISTFPIS